MKDELADATNAKVDTVFHCGHCNKPITLSLTPGCERILRQMTRDVICQDCVKRLGGVAKLQTKKQPK